MTLYATNRFAGDGTTTQYEINFVGQYIDRSHVKAYRVNDATQVRTPVTIAPSQWLNATTITGFAPTPVGQTLVIYRDTPKAPLVDFVNGSRFTEYNMDLVARQGLFVAMEELDAAVTARDAAVNAANSASAAAGSASAASTSASNAAGSASTAATRAGSAATSATNAGNSATAAANSASAASTSASNAATSATNAANSASAAATSATDAANSASAAANSAAALTGSGPMCCCRVVVANAASRIVRVERCGGSVVTINGVQRVLPAGGLQVTLPNTSTPQYVYLSWSNGSLTASAKTAAPTFNGTYGQWTDPGNPDSIPVAYVRPNGLGEPGRFLRNYYNGHGGDCGVVGLSADFTGDWDGIDRQLLTVPILLLPGDTIDVSGHANIMSTPPHRVGDLTVRLSGNVLCRARHTYAGAPSLWHNYSCRTVIQRGAADPAQQAIFELWYTPTSATGDIWTAQGEAAATRLNVLVTPYKWA